MTEKMTKERKERLAKLARGPNLPASAFENDRAVFKCGCGKDPCECEEEAAEP